MEFGYFTLSDNRFLFCTVRNSDYPAWLDLARELSNPSQHEDVQLVIDALKPLGKSNQQAR